MPIDFKGTGISTPPRRPIHRVGKSLEHLEPPFTEQKLIDQFRLYDQMVYDWLGGLEYPIQNKDGDIVFPSVPRVFATPERAFAKMMEVINKDKTQRFRRIDSIGQVPLPFISIWRQINEFDPQRYSRSVQRKMKYSDDCLEVRQSPYPSPQNIPYQIEFWTRNRTIINYLLQWLALQFDNNVLYLGLNLRDFDLDMYPDPIAIQVKKDNFQDTSDLEPGEEQRNLRHTLSMTVRGFLFRPIRTVKTVEKTVFDVIDKNSNAIVDNVEITSSDIPEKECKPVIGFDVPNE